MDLVTGGSGLVGSHLLFELAQKGGVVRATARKNSNLKWVEKLFEWYGGEEGLRMFARIEWVDADITDFIGMRDALSGVKRVFHCAAIVSFLPADKKKMLNINIDGTANVVNACLEAGIERFCHCSSVASLGQPQPGQMIDESLIWKTSRQNSWYAISKFGAEREVWRGAEEGLNTVIVNPSIVIGPGDTSRSSGQLYQSAKKGLRFYTKGITGFVDVRDVATSMSLLADSEVSGQRFIVNSENLPYREVFAMFAHATGTRPPDIYAGPLLSSVAWRLEKLRSLISGSKPLITRETAHNANNKREFSNDKIIHAIGMAFRPVEEAVQNTAEFFKKHPELSRQ